MTVTLEIPPEMEAQLCERAAKRGQSVTDYLMTLAESEDYFDISLSEEEIASVEQGLAELHAGEKGISLEEFDAEMKATIARLKQKELKVAA